MTDQCSFLFLAKAQAGNFQQAPQRAASLTDLREGMDAIMEHQRLHALMKGEWGKGLLPQSSVRADYTVQRIRGKCFPNCLVLKEHVELIWCLLLCISYTCHLSCRTC